MVVILLVDLFPRLKFFLLVLIKKKSVSSVSSIVFRCVHASLYEGLSVRRSVHRSVTRFFLIAEIDKKQQRIIGKVETLFLDCKEPAKKSLKIVKKFQNNLEKKFCPTLWTHLCSNELVSLIFLYSANKLRVEVALFFRS